MDPHLMASATTREESPTQRQARIRRERREAKIKAGGSSRLDKITSLSGRPGESAQLTSLAPALGDYSTSSTTSHNPDPDEVDISQQLPSDARPLYFSRQTRAQDAAAFEGDIRRLLQGSGPDMQDDMSGSATAALPPGQPQHAGRPDGEKDLMMTMLQQIMEASGMPSREAGQKGDVGLPPGLATMLGEGRGMQPVEQKSNESAYRWKILHALLALALGIYISLVTSFTGASFVKVESDLEEVGVKFFWAFATVELVLQSSRFFLERGQQSKTHAMTVFDFHMESTGTPLISVVNRHQLRPPQLHLPAITRPSFQNAQLRALAPPLTWIKCAPKSGSCIPAAAPAMPALGTVVFIANADCANSGPSFTACLKCVPAAGLRMLPCGGAEIVIVRHDNEIIEAHCGATVGDEHEHEDAAGSGTLKS
ncbi:hypothetical protein MMC07_005560 [Pseudocyphellaria aurata]|nr:hypothetical protein [Pseudocyphellaria aurata]